MLTHTEYYSKWIENYMLRHSIKPGITGFAQITGYRGETKELQEMEGRVKRDIWYIEHWSFLLDVKIIIRTIFQWHKKDTKAY
jgi:putative colanic acid biosynthesis UDP-glucose lipid carrier transferase